MVASTLVDLVKVYAVSNGTGALTLGQAVPGYRGVEALANGATYSYSIQQNAEYETGKGTYLLVGKQLVRTPGMSSNGGTAINIQAGTEVAFVALAEDILARDVLQPLYGFGAPLSGQGLPGQVYYDLDKPVTLYGPKSEIGWGSGVVLQGDTGTAASYSSLAALKAADPAALFYVLITSIGPVNYALVSGNFTGRADDVNVVKLNALPLTTGALVRQGAQSTTFAQFSDASIRDTQNKVRDLGVSPRDAPGYVDGDVNQSIYVQWAIDKCLATDPPAPLDVAGLFRIDTPLIVNRTVDQSKARFMLAGRGHQAGFRVAGVNTIFDSTISYSTDPVSERLSFRDILFTADTAGTSARTFTAGKFLRMQFDNCEWERLACVTSTIYAQSWDFRACRARNWTGLWFDAAGAYAINAEMEAKFGGGMFRLLGTRGITQSSFTRGTYEALSGPVLTAGGAAGVAINNNYIEFNSSPSIKLDSGLPNTSVSLIGNIFVQDTAQLADATFYDVIWGATRRGYSAGNTCNGRLHDTSGVTGVSNQVQLYDYAAIELYKGYKAGLFDQSRASVGNVVTNDTGILAASSGVPFIGLDSGGTLAFGPGEVQAGAYVPIRQGYGAANPQTNPGTYGNPYWTRGSVIWNQSATGDGQPDYWRCVASGQPGTWRAQVIA